MKVGIVTIYDNTNYGNKLQNYALQKVLENLGCDVKTLVKQGLLINHDNEKSKRRQEFSLFAKKYLNVREYGNLKKIQHEFDYFVIGSDQIWNPYVRLSSEFKFAKFAPKEKRIAYAPSFGLSKIPFIFYPIYKNGLKGISSLSTREHAGQKIIKKFTTKECPVLVDPTMLLTKNEWENFANASLEENGENYILTYFLGKRTKYNSFIEKVAKENNCKILNLNDKLDLNLYAKNPIDFVSLIKNAKLICTDSFHGCVFSIILERPFVVFKRDDIQKNAGSRIDTLLSSTEMIDRKFDNLKISDIFDINFDISREKIKNEREKSFSYLKKSLNLQNVEGK